MTETTIPALATSFNPGSIHTPERIRARLIDFSPAERRVADAVLRDPFGVIHLSVSELAASADTSPATVIRFCATLGLRGFQELKITLASESIPSERRVLGEIQPGDGVAEITLKVMDTTARAVGQAAQTLDLSVLEAIAEQIVGALFSLERLVRLRRWQWTLPIASPRSALTLHLPSTCTLSMSAHGCFESVTFSLPSATQARPLKHSPPPAQRNFRARLPSP